MPNQEMYDAEHLQSIILLVGNATNLRHTEFILDTRHKARTEEAKINIKCISQQNCYTNL